MFPTRAPGARRHLPYPSDPEGRPDPTGAGHPDFEEMYSSDTHRRPQ
ncbi:hypothetical protein Pta02_53290 [Planobispora takensis]|uniref:Uncharacterized protein n=1 Tax=Planobispora takensis TaxID=1367882 RepID=A0A8J3T0Y0_9ACTN|nr:hypothetical protein Pta02_53290 [Planobispora takensis]